MSSLLTGSGISTTYKFVALSMLPAYGNTGYPLFKIKRQHVFLLSMANLLIFMVLIAVLLENSNSKGFNCWKIESAQLKTSNYEPVRRISCDDIITSACLLKTPWKSTHAIFGILSRLQTDSRISMAYEYAKDWKSAHIWFEHPVLLLYMHVSNMGNGIPPL